MQSFKEMDLVPALREALELMNYETPTPVQAAAIPLVLEGSDLMACAQTGTGKTAAFALPLLARLSDKNSSALQRKSVLILAPTRELVEQIAEVIRKLTVKMRQHKLALIIGGVGYNHQIRELRANPSFIIATPGRLIDHLEAGRVRLDNFGVLVLDEADRMLDMGFAPQLEEIVSRMPKDRQTLLFSATLDGDVAKMAKNYLRDPKSVNVAPAHTPIEKITQNVIRTLQKEKPSTLLKEIDKMTGSIIIFTRTKSRTEQVAKNLDSAGHDVELIHGDRSQGQRKRSLDNFRLGEVRILVATDVAARGLDIPHIEHVFNYDLPTMPEDYVHRIGRTGRAGREGNSWSFVTPDEEQQWNRIYKIMYGKFPDGAKRPGGASKRPWENNRGPQSGPRSAPRRSSPSRLARNESRRSNVGGERPAFAGASSRPASRPTGERSERPMPVGFGDRPRTERPRDTERTFANREERDAARTKRPTAPTAKTTTPTARAASPIAKPAAPTKRASAPTARAEAAPTTPRMAVTKRDHTNERPERSDRPQRSEKPALGGDRTPKRSYERRDRDSNFADTKPASKPSSKPTTRTEGPAARVQKRRMDDRPQAEGVRPQRKSAFAPPWARKRETKPAAKPRHKSLV